MNKDYKINKILSTYLHNQNIKALDLARMSGISRHIIYNVLQGRTALRVDDFVKICEALNVTADEILTYPGTEN